MISRLSSVAVMVIISLVASTTAQAASSFTNTQTSQRWIVVDPHIAWTRQYIAIGPHEWRVSYKKNGTDYATEEWKAPDIFTCHKNPQACRPNGVNGGNGSRYNQWFWGLGWEVGRYDSVPSIPDYIVLDSNDSRLYTINNNCPRGIGSALAWLSAGDCRGTFAYFNTGPGGWAYGQLDRSFERDGPQQIGLQLPLQWSVRGFYNTAPPPSNGGGE